MGSRRAAGRPGSRAHALKREILISGSPRETRVAILEDDRLVELLVDRPDARRMVGDIYLGTVDAVLPGIQAAFVDRKSTRLNSSHSQISYAVFCLKKKKNNTDITI